jgi:hypothetical protein
MRLRKRFAQIDRERADWKRWCEEAENKFAAVQYEPQLGYATTRELLTELKARGEVSHTIGEYPDEMGALAIGAANILESLPGSMLDYRTAAHWRGRA